MDVRLLGMGLVAAGAAFLYSNGTFGDPFGQTANDGASGPGATPADSTGGNGVTPGDESEGERCHLLLMRFLVLCTRRDR